MNGLTKSKEGKVDFVAIGTLAVDYFALVPIIPGEEQKIMATGYEVHPGGVAGNVLTQVARLGVRSGWIGKIGADESGKILLNEFSREGIDSSHTEVVKDRYSMFTWIQVDNRGNRAITMFPNVIVELTEEDIEKKHRGYIENSRILQTEICVMPLKPLIKAMEIAKSSGIKTVLDLDVPVSYFVDEAGLGTKDEVFKMISLADILIPCKAGAEELIGSKNYEKDIVKILEMGPEIAAVTVGEEGCIIASKNKVVKIPTYKVEVVDTTGAGDAFHGGFIYGLLNGYDLEDIGKIANACGAFCCTRVGARSSGKIDDIKRIMDSQTI